MTSKSDTAVELRPGAGLSGRTMVADGGGQGEAGLWSALQAPQSASQFASGWLALTCRSNPAIRQGVLVWKLDGKPLEPAARWVRDETAARDVGFADAATRVLDTVVAQAESVISAESGLKGVAMLGWPIRVGGDVQAVVVVSAVIGDDLMAKRVLRHLQWASGWVEGYLLRSIHDAAAAKSSRGLLLLDIVGALGAEPGHRAACQVLAAEMAQALGCDRVGVGWREGVRSHVEALSQTATFDRKAALIQAIIAAMDEAVDQSISLLAPVEPGDGRLIAVAQERLRRETGALAILTTPLYAHGRAVGAMTLERMNGTGFSAQDIDVVEAVAAVAGAALEDKKRADRGVAAVMADRLRGWGGTLVGEQHLLAKALSLAAALALLATVLIHQDYRIHAKVQIQGEQRRVLGAPFDGYVRAQHVRAGHVVKEGDVLAEIEDSDIQLERLRHIARRRQYQLELDRALSKRELAQANIAKAQMEQADAEIDLANQMLARTRIKAPFAGIVVSGDLSQSVGKPVSRGDTLFELAPLDRYRVTAMVPEGDIRSVHIGSTGQVLLSALPEQPFEMRVTTVTSVARVVDGANTFEVVGELARSDERVRPGMEGVAKISAGPRRTIVIWTQSFFYWFRLRLWAWLP